MLSRDLLFVLLAFISVKHWVFEEDVINLCMAHTALLCLNQFMTFNIGCYPPHK